MQTSDECIYAIGECALYEGMIYGLIAPGYEMADVAAAHLAFNQSSDVINYNGTYYTPANVPATIKDSKGNLANTPAGFIPLINAAGISSKTGSPALLNPPGTNALNQNYKSLEYLYVAKKINKTKISGLFLADQFGKYKPDSVKMYRVPMLVIFIVNILTRQAMIKTGLSSAPILYYSLIIQN